MDEHSTMNKKNILMVFVGFTVVFLFLYKGFILSGDEYYDTYNELTNTSYSKTSSLKKPKSTDTSASIDPEKKLEKKFFSDLNINMDSIEADLKAFRTSLTNYIENNNVPKDKISLDNIKAVLDKIDNSKEIIKEFQNKRNGSSSNSNKLY